MSQEELSHLGNSLAQHGTTDPANVGTCIGLRPVFLGGRSSHISVHGLLALNPSNLVESGGGFKGTKEVARTPRNIFEPGASLSVLTTSCRRRSHDDHANLLYRLYPPSWRRGSRQCRDVHSRGALRVGVRPQLRRAIQLAHKNGTPTHLPGQRSAYSTATTRGVLKHIPLMIFIDHKRDVLTP